MHEVSLHSIEGDNISLHILKNACHFYKLYNYGRKQAACMNERYFYIHKTDHNIMSIIT